MFTEREKFLMREAMKAGTYYRDLDSWLNESIADGGHIVADQLSHDADLVAAALNKAAEPEAPMTDYQKQADEQARDIPNTIEEHLKNLRRCLDRMESGLEVGNDEHSGFIDSVAHMRGIIQQAEWELSQQ